MIERFSLIETCRYCLVFKSNTTGKEIELSKKFIKEHYTGNIYNITSIDLVDDRFVFHSLGELIVEKEVL